MNKVRKRLLVLTAKRSEITQLNYKHSRSLKLKVTSIFPPKIGCCDYL